MRWPWIRAGRDMTGGPRRRVDERQRLCSRPGVLGQGRDARESLAKVRCVCGGERAGDGERPGPQVTQVADDGDAHARTGTRVPSRDCGSTPEPGSPTRAPRAALSRAPRPLPVTHLDGSRLGPPPHRHLPETRAWPPSPCGSPGSPRNRDTGQGRSGASRALWGRSSVPGSRLLTPEAPPVPTTTGSPGVAQCPKGC